MSALIPQLNTLWAPRLLSVLRIITAFLFLQHGTAKLFGFPHVAFFDELSLFSLIGFAGVLEVVGGLLLVLGLFTRPVAFILSGEMAFAYFIGHFPRGFIPILNGGENAIMFCFCCLYIFCAGGGPYSVDGMRGAKT